MRRGCLLLVLAAATAVPVAARGDEPTTEDPAQRRRVEVRVTFASGASAYLDRGSDDGLEVGDTVTLLDGTRGRVEARIVAVSSSTSRATTVGGGDAPVPGSQGWVHVPVDRAGAAEPEVEEGPKRATEHPEWSGTIGERDPDAPLLAPAFSIPSHERTPTVRGRVRAQAIIDQDRSGDADDTFSLYRGGLDLTATNLFGRGGSLVFSGDLERRVSEVDGLDDETEDDARLDRLYYRWGEGFDSPVVVSLGRFVPIDTPELGLVDGAEARVAIGSFGHLTLNGGALPEPSADRNTFDDTAVTLAWTWASSEKHELQTALAFQQTWHEGDRDRSLVLARADWAATPEITLHGDAWVDLYDSDDTVKGSGAELTEAHGSAVWRVSRDHGVRASASYTRWPELLRWEFDEVSARYLEDNEVLRCDVGGWHTLGEGVRLDERIGVWDDQDDSGLTGDVGVRLPDLIVARNEPGVRVFRFDGSTEDGFGLRLSDRHSFDDVAVAVGWEISRHDYDLDGDVRTRHALLGSVDVYTGADWSLSLEADYRFGDDQDAMSLGVFVEYRF